MVCSWKIKPPINVGDHPLKTNRTEGRYRQHQCEAFRSAHKAYIFCLARFTCPLMREIRKDSETRMRGSNPHPEC